MDLGARGNDIAKQRFGAFDVDGEIVIDEEDGHLAFFAAGALLQPEQFTNHALISTEANRVSEKSGHRAELAPVGTTSSGLDGNDVKGPPAFSYVLEHGARGFGHQIELVKIDRLPRNGGIVLERWLAFFAAGIDWGVDVFEPAADGIVHNQRPGFIGFAESHGVGVTHAAIAAEGLIRQFGDVRSAHDYRHSCSADGVGHAIGLGDHSGHRADADQPNLLVAHVLRDLRLVHGLSVAID